MGINHEQINQIAMPHRKPWHTLFEATNLMIAFL
jgi:hypothetical protein